MGKLISEWVVSYSPSAWCCLCPRSFGTRLLLGKMISWIGRQAVIVPDAATEVGSRTPPALTHVYSRVTRTGGRFTVQQLRLAAFRRGSAPLNIFALPWPISVAFPCAFHTGGGGREEGGGRSGIKLRRMWMHERVTWLIFKYRSVPCTCIADWHFQFSRLNLLFILFFFNSVELKINRQN